MQYLNQINNATCESFMYTVTKIVQNHITDQIFISQKMWNSNTPLPPGANMDNIRWETRY